MDEQNEIQDPQDQPEGASDLQSGATSVESEEVAVAAGATATTQGEHPGALPESGNATSEDAPEPPTTPQENVGATRAHMPEDAAATTPQGAKKGYTRKPWVKPEISEARSRAARASQEAYKRNKTVGPAVLLARHRHEEKELQEWIEELRQHIAQHPEIYRTPNFDAWTFLAYGHDILSAAIWNRKSIDHVDPSNQDLFLWDDNQLPEEEQQYIHFYLAEAAGQMCGLGRQVHLTEPLVKFLVKVLNTVKRDYFQKNPEGKFTREEVADCLQELDLRKQGVDTFDPWPEHPRKKLGWELDLSIFPPDLKEAYLKFATDRTPLTVMQQREYMEICLQQPDLPDYMRKDYEDFLRTPRTEPKEERHDDPMTKQLSASYVPPATVDYSDLPQDALGYLRNGRR